MSNPIGHMRWAIAEGYIPASSHGPEPQMTSHETVCLLNSSDRDAHVPTSHAPAFYFLDLPGYGYARASRGRRTGFRRLVARTLDREGLVGAVWLLDLRHDPSVDDRTMQDALAAAGTRVLAALTKSDKLPRGQRLRRADAVRELLGLDADQAIVTSARTGEGVAELREAISELVREEGT